MKKSVKRVTKKSPAKVKQRTLLEAITSFILLSIIVIGFAVYFVFDEKLIGPAFLLLGLINLGLIKIHKIEIKSTYPDMIFGFIDNGVLVIAAVLGGHLAGIPGAIIGGAAGNTITDGIGGIFEGYVAQHQRKFKINTLRSPASTMLGKMAGCLFGAGIGLTIVWIISLI